MKAVANSSGDSNKLERTDNQGQQNVVKHTLWYRYFRGKKWEFRLFFFFFKGKEQCRKQQSIEGLKDEMKKTNAKVAKTCH